MSNLNLQKLREWVWPWPWTFNSNKTNFLSTPDQRFRHSPNYFGPCFIAYDVLVGITLHRCTNHHHHLLQQQQQQGHSTRQSSTPAAETIQRTLLRQGVQSPAPGNPYPTSSTYTGHTRRTSDHPRRSSITPHRHNYQLSIITTCRRRNSRPQPKTFVARRRLADALFAVQHLPTAVGCVVS